MVLNQSACLGSLLNKPDGEVATKESRLLRWWWESSRLVLPKKNNLFFLVNTPSSASYTAQLDAVGDI